MVRAAQRPTREIERRSVLEGKIHHGNSVLSRLKNACNGISRSSRVGVIFSEGRTPMKVEYGTLEGDIRITEEIELRGIADGNVTVADGGWLVLHGIVAQDLILENGADVELYGTVGGTVYNRGGNLSVYGTIVQKLRDEAGVTTIDPEAMIGRH